MFSKINHLTFENNAYETLQIGCYLSNNCKEFCFITKVNFNENLKFVTVDYPHNSVTPSSACFWVANTGYGVLQPTQTPASASSCPHLKQAHSAFRIKISCLSKYEVASEHKYCTGYFISTSEDVNVRCPVDEVAEEEGEGEELPGHHRYIYRYL